MTESQEQAISVRDGAIERLRMQTMLSHEQATEVVQNLIENGIGLEWIVKATPTRMLYAHAAGDFVEAVNQIAEAMQTFSGTPPLHLTGRAAQRSPYGPQGRR